MENITWEHFRVFGILVLLDREVTGSVTTLASQLHHHEKRFYDFCTGSAVWYLSDGGYSRLVWKEDAERGEQLYLTSGSTDNVKARWDSKEAEELKQQLIWGLLDLNN